MLTCSSCAKSAAGRPGPGCPLHGRLPASFSAGCSAHEARQIREDARSATIRPTRESAPQSDAGKGTTRQPNATEADYAKHHLMGMDARYEALTFRMSNGHRYTPDWVVFVDGRPVACHECKGGYALHSQQRARLAFDQAALEFTGLAWVWAVKTPDGWRIKKVENSFDINRLM